MLLDSAAGAVIRWLRQSKCAGVPGDEKMLTVVNDISRGGVGEGRRSSTSTGRCSRRSTGCVRN